MNTRHRWSSFYSGWRRRSQEGTRGTDGLGFSSMAAPPHSTLIGLLFLSMPTGGGGSSLGTDGLDFFVDGDATYGAEVEL